MLTLYIFSAVVGGGMVLVSLLSSLSSHHDTGGHGDGHGGHGAHDGHGHADAHGGHDHDAGHHDGGDAGGHDAHADHGGHAVDPADAQAGPEADADADSDAEGEACTDEAHAHAHHAGDGQSDHAPAHGHGPAHGQGSGQPQAGARALAPRNPNEPGGDLGFLAFLRLVRPTSHFLSGFGATGLLTTLAGFAEPISGSVAAATGALTLLVGTQASRLRSQETTSAIGEEDLLGCSGEVVIRVGPGDAAGRVRIHVKGAAPEFVAVAAKPDLVLTADEKIYVVNQRPDGILRVDRNL